MLLTLLNLPKTVKYNEIKALVHSKCGIKDIILDNLTQHENNTKKVTVGVAGEEDAAIIMRKINGLYMDGQNLQVIPKSKISDSNKHGPVAGPPTTNYGQQGSNWYPPNYGPPGQTMPNQIMPYQSMPHQNMPHQNMPHQNMPHQNMPHQNMPVVPSPMNYGMYSNQTAFYQMNQPDYPTQSTSTSSSIEKVGYPEPYSYGNRSYESNNQIDWPQNNWNQQQQHPSGFSNTQEKPNRESNWDSNQSRWDSNQQSKWNDSRDSKRTRNSDSEWDSRQDNSRDANRDRYQSNQMYGSSQNRDSSNMRNDQNNAGSSFHNAYGNNRSGSSDRGRNDRSDRFNQHGNKSGRSRSDYDEDQLPAAKRSRFSNNTENERKNRRVENKTAPEPSGFKGSNSNFRAPQSHWDSRTDGSNKLTKECNMWRAQLASKYANKIMTDRCCIYKRVNNSDLFDELKRIIRGRIDKLFKNDYAISIKDMDERYASKYNDASHCNVLKDATKNLGGHVITVSRSQAAKSDNASQNNSNKSKINKGGFPSSDPQQGPIRKSGAPGGGNPRFGQQQRPPKNTGGLGEGNPGFAQQQGPQRNMGGQGGGNPRFGQQGPQKYMGGQGGGNPRFGQEQRPLKNTGGPGGGNPTFGQQQGPQKYMGSQSGGNPRFVPPNKMSGRGGGNQNFGPYKGPQKKPAQGGNRQTSVPLAEIPGKIPHYYKGDKREAKIQKKEAENIFKDHNYLVNLMKTLNPAIRLAIGEEMEILCKVIEDACTECTEDDANFAEKIKQLVPRKMKTLLKVNLTKRIIPILPIKVSAYATPPIKRWALENFLTRYDVCALKKARNKPMYVIDCNSVYVHDLLCEMGSVKIEKSMVTFKPFHLVGARVKVKRADILQKRKQLKYAQIQHSDKNLGIPYENLWDLGKDDNVKEEKKEERKEEKKEERKEEEKEEKNEETKEHEYKFNVEAQELELGEICQEMKEIYDQINNPTEIEIDEAIVKHEQFKLLSKETKPPLKCKQEPDTTDFTTDIDIDNFGHNLKEDDGMDIGVSGQDADVSDPQYDAYEAGFQNSCNNDWQLPENDDQEANEFDFAELNEDDLEDW